MHADLFILFIYFFKYVCVYIYIVPTENDDARIISCSLCRVISQPLCQTKQKQQGLGDTDRGWGWFPGLRLNPGLKWDHTRCPIKSASVPGSSHMEILELRDLQVLPVRSKRPLKKSMKSLAFILT